MFKKLTIVFVVYLIGCATTPKVEIKQEHATTIKETQKAVSSYTGPKRRVAVVDFKNKTKYGERLGTSASDVLTTELVKSEKFIVVERTKMDKILQEQALQKEATIDQNTAVQVGKILGLNAIITGCVSQFGVKEEGADYLVTQHKRQKAEATVDIRVIDVETGQILYADSGKGIVERKLGQILGLGTKGGYDETIEGEALRAAIVKFTDNIISQINKKPWSCRIAAIEGNDIYLNAGQSSGLDLGVKLTIYSLGKEIKDPTTGLIIGYTQKKIGIIEVTGFFGEDGSIAKIIEGTIPKVGDLCRLE